MEKLFKKSSIDIKELISLNDYLHIFEKKKKNYSNSNNGC